MEQARLIAYYASLIHSTKRIKIKDFGLFPWENAEDYNTKFPSSSEFSPIDKEAFNRFNAIRFPDEIQNN